MGVSREVVDQSLEGLDEEEAAYHAAKGLVRRTTQPDYPTFRKKLFAHLRRRGFGGEAIRATIQRMWQELPDPADSQIEGTAPPEQPE